MDLVELVFPEAASQSTRERSFALCEQLGKTAVEVPDLPGFVVNRLLFPFLFEAVRLREETGLDPAAVDSCLQLGAGHPMGPLALLDLVGLDVAQSIGNTIGADVPERSTRWWPKARSGAKPAAASTRARNVAKGGRRGAARLAGETVSVSPRQRWPMFSPG